MSFEVKNLPARCLFLAVAVSIHSHAGRGAEVDFEKDVAPVLTKHCAGCHNDTDAEEGFSVHSISRIHQGGNSGPVVDLGEPSKSKLLGILEGIIEPKMPPEDEEQLDESELLILRKWVLAGAKASSQSSIALMDRADNLATSKSAKQPALEYCSTFFDDGHMLAIGYEGKVVLRKMTSDQADVEIGPIAGRVTSIREAASGKLVIASGVPGVGGQVTIFDPMQSKLVKQFDAHQDIVYAAVLNPQGNLLATGGYDRDVLLWNPTSGELVAKLAGHNGAIYDLDFDHEGKLLCSASADETIKLWNVVSCERLDTFSQCEGEQYSCRFNAAGDRVYAAGADRRLRCWKIINRLKPEVNPMLLSVFAHEAAVTHLCFSPDNELIFTVGIDKQLKVWNSLTLAPIEIAARLEAMPVSLSLSPSQSAAMITLASGHSISLPVNLSFAKAEEKTTTPTAKGNTPMPPSQEYNDYIEVETSDSVRSALAIQLPAMIDGTIASSSVQADVPDSDFFRFNASAGAEWVLTVKAQTEGSPLDSRIEILYEDGTPVLRTRLQALRETYFTFRAKNSSQSDDYRLHRWEDMELNELIFANGEVNKLWLYPRGPDSGFLVYPGMGNRWTYFDTTATTHALNEPAYIVRELQPDEMPIPNGLPVFPIYFENDDDADRTLGKDSQLYFKAPKDGSYVVRVRDARDLQNEDFKYRLEIRSPQPDFAIAASAKKPLIVGTGTELHIDIIRKDNFAGPVEVQLEGLPPGVFYSQPLYVEEEQTTAVATLYADLHQSEILPESITVSVSAKARVGDTAITRTIDKPVTIQVERKDVLRPRLVPSGGDHDSPSLAELVIHPGETITANVLLEGGDNVGEYAFGVEDSNRNFPHGIIISNIGLNGLLLPAGHTNRQFFITAAPWVKPQVRPIHLRNKNGDNETTQPILLRVVAE